MKLTQKCAKCGDLVDNYTRLCLRCGFSAIHSAFVRASQDNEIPIIWVGDMLAAQTAKAILEGLDLAKKEDRAVQTLTLRGRGRNIGRAVDVLEIIRRNVGEAGLKWESRTQEMKNDDDKAVNVSELDITIEGLA